MAGAGVSARDDYKILAEAASNGQLFCWTEAGQALNEIDALRSALMDTMSERERWSEDALATVARLREQLDDARELIAIQRARETDDLRQIIALRERLEAAEGYIRIQEGITS